MKRKSQAKKRRADPGRSPPCRCRTASGSGCGGCSTATARQRDPDGPAPRPGARARPADFFPNPAALDTTSSSAWPRRAATPRSPSASASPKSTCADYAGRVPLILKLNGKTNIPDDAEAVSPAVRERRGRRAAGRGRRGLHALRRARRGRTWRSASSGRCGRTASASGCRSSMWAYPRGRAIEAKGGKGTLFAQDYAARVAEELGADVVKLHEPRTRQRAQPGALPLAARGRRPRGCAGWCARRARCWCSSRAA